MGCQWFKKVISASKKKPLWFHDKGQCRINLASVGRTDKDSAMDVTRAQRDHIENVTKLVNIRVRRQNNGVIHTRCAQCNYTQHFPSVSQPHSIFHKHNHSVNTMYSSTPYSTVLTHGGAPRLQRLHGPLLLVGPRLQQHRHQHTKTTPCSTGIS